MVKIGRILFKYLLSIRCYFIKNICKNNIYNTAYEKKVLIIYLNTAFKNRKHVKHSNIIECSTAAEIFNNLGYQVDVINYNASYSPDLSKYDIIYGMGPAFEKTFYKKDIKALRIFYATGCNPIYSNIATTLKVREFNLKKNVLLPESSRIIPESQHFQILLSDSVIVLGNNYVKSTYTRFDPQANRYFNLNAFFFDVNNPILENKDFSKARKNYLWFGSSGALHKGLDIVIEIFLKHKDLTLHICGLSPTEESFFAVYKEQIERSGNIINHGFVNLRSEEFKQLMKNCCFIIFPSVSEGGAVALLNVIANGGLIPIYSKSTGVDLSIFGAEINEISIPNFTEKIIEYSHLTNEEIKEKSELILKHVRNNYSYSNYKKNLSDIIHKAISR